jgi:hypothetical protein
MRSLIVLLVFSVVFASPAGTGPAGDRPDSARGPTPGGAVVEERLEEFIPSEEISADRAISFPVDI